MQWNVQQRVLFQAFLILIQQKPLKCVHTSHKSRRSPIFRFLSPLEQEDGFLTSAPADRAIGQPAVIRRIYSLLPSGGADVMAISWAAKHSETHPSPEGKPV